MFHWDSLSLALKVIDVAALAVFVLYVGGVHRAWRKRRRRERSREERDLAASAMGNFVSVGVGGASVLIAGIGILLALQSDTNPLPQRVSTELTAATVFLVASIACGFVTQSYVLTHLHHRERSVAEEPLVMAFGTGQLFGLFLGGAFFLLALFLM
jgi:hypothetical protein